MIYSLNIPTDRVSLKEQFISGDAVAKIAMTAEESGFYSVHVTDHPFPSVPWLDSGGHHALDPFVVLSFASAATNTIKLMTHVYIIPYRNPFLTAKAVVSLDTLSGGRFIFGAAAGYLEPEFSALGIDYSERNTLTDESLIAMKTAWTGNPVNISNQYFSADNNLMLPTPVQKPHPPIWIGGNSKRAIRRAVEHGNGWMPFPNTETNVPRRRTPALDTIDALSVRIDYASEYANSIGRTEPLSIIFTPSGLGSLAKPGFDLQRFMASVESLQKLGVSGLTIGLPGQTLEEFLANIRWFGKEILSKSD